MTRSRLAVIAALASLFVLQIATSVRLAGLQNQLAKWEERAGGGAVAAAATARDPGVAPATRPGMEPTSSFTPESGADRGSCAPAGLPAAADLPMLRKDVEALIAKKIAEYDEGWEDAAWEDPMTVMERELRLSPIQKTRIAGHMKERDEAAMDLWGAEGARRDWRGTEAKVGELRKQCDEAIRRELDLAQQDRYEELKKSGQLVDIGGGGGTIVIGDFGRKKEEGEGK